MSIALGYQLYYRKLLYIHYLIDNEYNIKKKINSNCFRLKC